MRQLSTQAGMAMLWLVVPCLAAGVPSPRSAISFQARAALALWNGGAAVAGSGQGRGNAPGRARGAENRGGQEGEEGENEQGRHGGRTSVRARVFSESDQGLIRHYFADTSNLPPGLAKRGGNLPPGLERQLRRNGTLPPGLQKRVQPFPEELSRRLPPLPSGWSRVVVAGRAIILDHQQRIADIMTLFR